MKAHSTCGKRKKLKKMIRENEILRCLFTGDWTTVLQIFFAVGQAGLIKATALRTAKN
jgi:hypothetical protein